MKRVLINLQTGFRVGIENDLRLKSYPGGMI